MKNFKILFLVLVPFAARAMDQSLHDSLQWLSKDIDFVAPELVTAISHGWGKGMSFLARYLEANFNEADIYEDKVFFNECTYSTAIYQMTYAHIQEYFKALSYIPETVQPVTGDGLRDAYIELIHKWKKFNTENRAYANAWRNGDCQALRNIIRTKQISG